MKGNNFFKKLGSKMIWLNLLAMVVVLVLLIFGVSRWLLAYTHHGELIEIPDFYGMDFHKAKALAEENSLRIVVNDSTYIKEMAAGCVVMQLPAKGMNVKESRIVYVTINSLTIPRKRIPAGIIGEIPYRTAKNMLENMGFKITDKYVDGEKGLVVGIEQDGRKVRVGDEIAVESQLTLLVGQGRSNGYYDDDEDIYYMPEIDSSVGNSFEWEYDEEDDFTPVIDEEGL